MGDSDDYVLDAVRTWVWSGFYAPDEINVLIDDILDEDTDEALVRAAVLPEFEKKQAAEASWPAVTDCDRLDRVFAALNEAGIVALQNAGYTMSDGFDDVDEEVSLRGKENVLGYCFYHGQDLERAVAGGGLTLAFGDLDADDAQKVEVGNAVRAALKHEGFAADWDGNPGRRINIPAFDWKRRSEKRPGGGKGSWIGAIVQRLTR